MAIVSSENIIATADVATFVNNIKNYVSGKIEYDFNVPPQFTGTSVFNPAKNNKTKYCKNCAAIIHQNQINECKRRLKI